MIFIKKKKLTSKQMFVHHIQIIFLNYLKVLNNTRRDLAAMSIFKLLRILVRLIMKKP